MLMAIVSDFARAAQVVHEAAVRQRIYGDLRGLVRHRQYELAGFLYFGLVAVTPYHIQVTAPSCIYVMDHVCAFPISP